MLAVVLGPIGGALVVGMPYLRDWWVGRNIRASGGRVSYHLRDPNWLPSPLRLK